MSKPAPLLLGSYYHIYNRGNNREDIFIQEPNYNYFLTLYLKYVEPVADTYAYCLLRNHFHLLERIPCGCRVRPVRSGRPDRSRPQRKPSTQAENALVRIKTKERDPKGLEDLSGLDPSQSFGNLFNAYTKAINKRYGRTGSLFQHPFGRIQMTSDEYFVYLIHYIQLNPQKHGFVNDFPEYPYSSFRTLCSSMATRIKREQVLAWFGGRESFERSHQEQLIEKRIAKFVGED